MSYRATAGLGRRTRRRQWVDHPPSVQGHEHDQRNSARLPDSVARGPRPVTSMCKRAGRSPTCRRLSFISHGYRRDAFRGTWHASARTVTSGLNDAVTDCFSYERGQRSAVTARFHAERGTRQALFGQRAQCCPQRGQAGSRRELMTRFCTKTSGGVVIMNSIADATVSGSIITSSARCH